jgi:hypothetical protein
MPPGLRPCGKGSVVEEYHNIPGFPEHSVVLACESRPGMWDFVLGLGSLNWRPERKIA